MTKGPISFLGLILTIGLYLPPSQAMAKDPPVPTKAPPISNTWLKILDEAVKGNGGKIPIDEKLSVVVDREGPGKAYFLPATEREKQYAEALVKLRSLATKQLYSTPAGQRAYLKLYNPEWLKRFAERLEFANPANRNNLTNQKFKPRQLPEVFRHVQQNTSYVLNLKPEFTGTFMAFSAEDDVDQFLDEPGKNNLFKWVDGATNGQTVRVNVSEKQSQVNLLATWLVEGNEKYGIPKLGIDHPLSRALIVCHMAAMEHDGGGHMSQYFFKPIDYLSRVVAEQYPEVMDPNSPSYGLIKREAVEEAKRKLYYEMDGFYISGFFRRGHEKETEIVSDFIEDLRTHAAKIRGLPGAEKWAPNLWPLFEKDGVLNWLQDGTNTRDIVKVYMRGDSIKPDRNLWFIDDAKVLPDSMRPYMYTQFDPALAVTRLHEINEQLKSMKTLSKPEAEQLAKEYAEIQAIWKKTVETMRESGDLDSIRGEFKYLKPVVDRFEGNKELRIQGETKAFEDKIRSLAGKSLSCYSLFVFLRI